MPMSSRQTLLKVLLMKRHQETHRAFCLEYDKVARSIDRHLIGSSPSREAYGRWLKGHLKTKPQADHCRVLERMFPGHTVAELLAPYDPGLKNPGVQESRPDPREAATNRREVFQLGATTMALGLTEGICRGPDLFEQVLDSNNVGEARLLYLENEADRLGRTVPPADLLPDALLHLTSVRELLTHRQPAQAQRRLTKVGAKLSIVIGEIMFCANHFPLARRWYGTAARASAEAGDGHLADLTLASSALLPTYSSDPRSVLAMVGPRLEQAVGATPALAWMWGLAALAHASLGDRTAFERANTRSRNTLERCSADASGPGILSFQPERQTFYEARGRADLGDLDGTADAVTRTLSSSDAADSNDPALVRLAYACALAKAGEVEEACRFATAAIRDTPTGQSITVVVRAHEFDALLTSGGSATADWREALSEARAPDPRTLPSLSSPRT
ncbi:hypothetical protein Skr01_26250 [Sphaerisporangium krabiense]|uniref:XRE family transcriptional regulator n=1 Tax=Sphaerisporangium krabiense TaxID=763782 RepID=A0A7W8ZAS2_9ACTN|nr:hypothetical protein [Sphaerisporangium krabiense]MBB5630506.1 hypothetical protein [Sphaerisporangium krabiense]GII62540.1 hypothetical protein Skr01_26250 [Sphaerisporangium krabiense]